MNLSLWNHRVYEFNSIYSFFYRISGKMQKSQKIAFDHCKTCSERFIIESFFTGISFALTINMIWVSKGLLTLIWYPDCYAATLLPQSSKYSKSADLLRKSLLSHIWRVPSSKALSCKHEQLFDLLTLVS